VAAAGAFGALALLLAGCDGRAGGGAASTARAGERSGPLPADYQPIRAGRGAGYRLAALSTASAAGRPLAGLRCSGRHPPAYGIHLELYARRLVVPVPAGIGIAAPQRREGAYVRGGACGYPLRTVEPTGVVIVDRAAGPGPRLGTLFRIWGVPLSPTRLAGFRGPVRAFVGGRRWREGPASIPLRRHAEIVLEVGGAVVPHPAYRFAPGL
jgi:hypothetical protein